MLLAADGAHEVADALADILQATRREEVALHAFAPGAPAPRVVAIDGSNVTVAESGAHLVGAHRIGRVELRDGVAVAAAPRASVLTLLRAGDAAPLLARLRACGVTDAQPPRLAASALLEHLRALDELAAAIDAVESMDAGDLLLLDGAIQARAAIPLADRLVERARERGVDVVGVCKSTSLVVGATPALVACRLAARSFAAPTWWAEIPAPASVRARVLVARLSPAEPRPFRFDVAAADDDPARVLPALAALAGHPAYPGYPSPLAMAHNAALIAEQERLRLRQELMDAVLARGVASDDWDAAFLDYHDVLELGA